MSYVRVVYVPLSLRLSVFLSLDWVQSEDRPHEDTLPSASGQFSVSFFFLFEVSKFNLSSAPLQTWWGRTGNGAVLIEQIVRLLSVPWIPISNEQPSINGGTAKVGSAPASKWKSKISRDGTIYACLDQNRGGGRLFLQNPLSVILPSITWFYSNIGLIVALHPPSITLSTWQHVSTLLNQYSAKPDIFSSVLLTNHNIQLSTIFTSWRL